MRVPAHPTIKVFIASPSDVALERKAAVRAIEWVSEHVAKPLDWRVEPVMWERDVLPGAGKDAQSVINQQIGEMRNVSLFLLIMRGKFGTPTARAKSGTAEEYERALAARKNRPSPKRPEIWLFFGESKPGTDPKQTKKVEEFRVGASRSALYKPFSTARDFETQFKNDLTRWVGAEIRRLSGPKSPRPAQFLTPLNAVLLDDRVYVCLRMAEDGDQTTLTLSLTSLAEENAVSALQNGIRFVPYAYRLSGGDARVTSVRIERNTKGAKAIVRLLSSRRGSSNSFVYSDAATRESAARQILLGTETQAKEGVRRFPVSQDLSRMVAPLLARADDAQGRAEARVRAVHVLLASGVVTEIQRLTLAVPMKDGVKITFSGRSTSMWGNSPATLRIEGFVKGPARRIKTKATDRT